jgi:hypothetical protein
MGTDFFTYLTTQAPEEFAVFDKAMVSLTAIHTGPAVAGHDWGRYGKVVDVGGGFGTLLEGLLRANPGEVGGSQHFLSTPQGKLQKACDGEGRWIVTRGSKRGGCVQAWCVPA